MADASIRVPPKVAPGEVFPVRAVVRHPMESGFRHDNVGKRIPRHVIEEFVCEYGGREVFRVQMGSGITTALLAAGLPVTLIDRSEAVLDSVRQAVGNHFDAMVKRGRLSPEDKAKRMGLKNSHFGTSNGWPDEGRTYVTARDLAALAQATVQETPGLYRKFYATRSFTWGKTMGGANIEQANRNPILGRIAGADGLKTGHTEEAGYGLTASAMRDGRHAPVLDGIVKWAGRTLEANDHLIRQMVHDKAGKLLRWTGLDENLVTSIVALSICCGVALLPWLPKLVSLLLTDIFAGLSVLAHLAAAMQDLRTKYTYRFLFAPGTIGAITWLARDGRAPGTATALGEAMIRAALPQDTGQVWFAAEAVSQISIDRKCERLG